MCFGPVASFTSGAILTVAGAATLKSVRSKKELLLALFPLLFEAQQIIEGFIWLAVEDGPLQRYQHPLTMAFLFFAYLFWPIFSPLSVYALEPEKKHKRAMLILLALGILTCAYLFRMILIYPPTVTVFNHSLRYQTQDRPGPLILLYLGATFVPYLISTYRPLVFLGVLNIIFCGITYYFHARNFDSVWCYFAAALSSGIFFFIRWLHRDTRTVEAVKLYPARPL